MVHGHRLDEILAVGRFVIEPVTESQARIARQAYREFGKGSGHAAQLKGDDFRHTDIPYVGGAAERRRLSDIWSGYGVASS